MKKLILVLAILLVASPVWAVLDVNIVKVDSDTVAITYTGADVNLPRAFALTVTINGTGTFTATSLNNFKTGESTASSRGFGIYPASITIDSAGVVSNYGTPLADPCSVGTTDQILPSQSIVLEFGSLYYGDVNAPAASGTLCTLDFTKGTATQITLGTEAVYRGGIVLENGDQTTDTFTYVIPVDECLSSSATEYAKWVEYGKPACWCFRKNCRGDADGQKTFLKPVMSSDLTIFKGAYNKSKADVKALVVSGMPGICADFDRADTFLKPVMSSDLTIFKAYYNDADNTVPECDQAPVTTGPYNFWTN
ncbi:MAG: hypothetical protein LLF92_01050 [Planctomycetaceae bacterium]|nr:hypothetical protein [Planctomycetaceae bacterium]